MSFSGNVTAVLGGELAQTLGKKGTESDITLYNHKLNDCVLSFVEPSSYPDKIQSLTTSINMADQILLKVDKIDSPFAETVVALDAAGIKKGYLIFGKNTQQESVRSLAPDSVIWSYQVIEEQPMQIKERLADLKLESKGDAFVPVDHSFSVRGVGTVALGVVRGGVVRKHDELTIYPSKKTAVVKSIQVHDTDVEGAKAGVRAGLALKDAKPEDVPRGSILSINASIKVTNRIEAEVRLSKYSPRPLGEGDTLMVNSNMNYIVSKVAKGSLKAGGSGRMTLELEKELTTVPGRMLLLDPGQKMPRVFGHAQL